MSSPHIRSTRSPLPARVLLTGALLATTLGSSASFARDGQLEINQTLALAGGVSPGDAPGFPVTITTAGSYVLTGPLTVSNLFTSAVLVTATADVTLDLNGFAIRGACPAVGGCAAGAGSSRGIDATASSGITLRDGRVIGFASDGVVAGARARIDGLFVEGNGGIGISVATGSEISASRTYDNAGTGIAISASQVRDCSAEANFDGIVAADRSMIEGNTVLDNSRIGIYVTGRSATVRGNVVANNFGAGIVVTQAGSLVVDNLVYQNAESGIVVSKSGSVQRNGSFENALGLYLVPTGGSNPAAYRGNAVANNAATSEVSGGVNMGENSCDGNATCP